MSLNERIRLKIGNEVFSCSVWFKFTKGYPAKLTGHPDDQFEGVTNAYDIERLTIYDGSAHWNAGYLINALSDVIEKELEKINEK